MAADKFIYVLDVEKPMHDILKNCYSFRKGGFVENARIYDQTLTLQALHAQHYIPR
jgi:hypothetical protein